MLKTNSDRFGAEPGFGGVQAAAAHSDRAPAESLSTDLAEYLADGRAALADCIGQIRSADGIAASARVLQHAGQVIGLPVVAVIHDISLPHGPNDESGAKLADIFGWPQAYTAHWETKGNTFHDLVTLRCRSEHLPFYWSAGSRSQLLQRDPSRKSSRITRELQALGLRGAFVTPVHLPRGRVGVVGWWGPVRPPPWPDLLVETASAPLLVLAHYFFDVLQAKSPVPAMDLKPSALSSREIECLTHAANGLTDDEMSRRLDVSAHTVRFHLINAATKLNARNRTHAVGLAAQQGVIGLVNEAPRTPEARG